MPSRGSTNDRGYGWKHQCLRAKWTPKVNAGDVDCWRCGQPIIPGQRWDLGHHDTDRSITIGPEHALARDCPAGGNRATAGRRKAKRQARPAALAFFTPPTPTNHNLGA